MHSVEEDDVSGVEEDRALFKGWVTPGGSGTQDSSEGVPSSQVSLISPTFIIPPATSPSIRAARTRVPTRKLLFKSLPPRPSAARGAQRLERKRRRSSPRPTRPLQKRKATARAFGLEAGGDSPRPGPRPAQRATPPQARLRRPIWSFGVQEAAVELCAAEGDVGRARVRRRNAFSATSAPGTFGTHEAAASCFGTMGLGARGVRAALLLGVLQVLALPGAAADSSAPAESPSVLLQNSSANSLADSMHNNYTSESNSSTTVKPSPTSVSLASKNVTYVTIKPVMTSKMATPGFSTNTTSTTLKSTSKATSVSQNVSQMSTSVTTTTQNSLATSLTITATIHFNEKSKFDTGSFVGGIVLTLGVLSILYIGCKIYYSRRGIRYRTIDEHDAII
nr:porimin [Marmota flaviventris]